MAQRLDSFSTRRLKKFIPEFRAKTGQLPTLQDFAENGFSQEAIDAAVHDGVIQKNYVTLTNGTIVKGYKVVI